LNYSEGNGTPRFNPFMIPKMIPDIAPGLIAMKYGFQGPNYATVSACASSSNALIDALTYIRVGRADVIVAGGSEAPVTIAGVGGFNAMHALSTRNDEPSSASRPFDRDRDGFVLGEGAGSLILEEYEHAVNRGAKIYAELMVGGIIPCFMDKIQEIFDNSYLLKSIIYMLIDCLLLEMFPELTGKVAGMDSYSF